MAQSPYSAPKIPVPAVKRGSPVHKRGGSERYEYMHAHVKENWMRLFIAKFIYLYAARFCSECTSCVFVCLFV